MIAFRDAMEADLPVVVRLLADDRLGEERERNETPLPDSYVQGFRAMLAQGGRLILAEQDGAVVGCLRLNVIHGVSHQAQTRAQVESVRVDSARRAGEIGAALMLHATAKAGAAGCGMMQLTTDSIGMRTLLKDIPITSPKKSIGTACKIATIIILFGFFVVSANVYADGFDRLCRCIANFLLDTFGEIGSLAAVLFLGILAYCFRNNFFTRILYAATEIYFGSVIAAIALLQLYRSDKLDKIPFNIPKLAPDSNKYLVYVALGSGIYIIVRGLDNGVTWMSQEVPGIRRLYHKARKLLSS